MRFCHHCRNWNSGWPLRCRRCSAGLEGRLCPRNHINPMDSRLAFCGECGQVLERNSGAGSQVRSYLLAFAILMLTGSLAVLALVFSKETPMTLLLIVLALLIFGFRLAMQVLPPAARKLIESALRGLMNLLFMLLFGTSNKERV